MKTRKLLALLLAVVMVVGALASCAKTPTAPTDPANPSTPSDPSSPSTPSTPSDPTTPAEKPYYTYHNYATATATNWNEHAWQMNNEDTFRGMVTMGFVDITINDSENGIYQWAYDMATSIEDVTKDHHDDMIKYGSTLPAGKTIDEVDSGFVMEIKLRPEACWQDGTPINADTYIYSMKQLLNPTMKNYRSNLYWGGESAIAGGLQYYNLLDEGSYVGITDLEGLAPEEIFVDVHALWGAAGYKDAAGNECPQYIAITDETVYSKDGTATAPGDSDTDSFTCKFLYENYLDYCTFFKFVKNPIEGATRENYETYYDDIVGVYKVDDYTIRYVLQTKQDFNYFLVSCTSTWLVYEPLYEGGKDTSGKLVTTNYCTSAETTFSYGPYKMTYFEPDKQAVWEKNENWYGWTKLDDGTLYSETEFLVDGEHVRQYMCDRYVIDILTDDAAKQAFLKGELDAWTPSAEELLTYGNSDRLSQVDETYTESFFFNTNVDALKAMDATKGNTNSVVLSNVNFRKAMSLATDRAEFVTATAGWKPAYSVMNSLYHYDIYNDPTSSYRSSEPAMQAICNVYGVEYGPGTPYATLKDAYNSINGYNLTEAKELMKTACKELVDAGLYKEGEDIYIRIGWAKGSLQPADQNQVALFNKFYNAAMEGSGFGKLTLEAIGNIANRYNDVPAGEFAIGWGAWGGAAFYPFRNFQVYCDPGNYSLNEAGCWDPTTTMLTINVNGVDDTMSWQEWSGALIGNGKYSESDNETKLKITAKMEEEWLKFYYRIPFAGMTACSLDSYKVNNYTEDYNIMYGFGGLRLLKFEYSDAEWADFVKSQGGTINYE